MLDKEAGRVIGRSGEVIKEIMAKSDSYIRVERQEDANELLPEERKVSIYAAEESRRERAKQLVLDEVSFAKDL